MLACLIISFISPFSFLHEIYTVLYILPAPENCSSPTSTIALLGSAVGDGAGVLKYHIVRFQATYHSAFSIQLSCSQISN